MTGTEPSAEVLLVGSEEDLAAFLRAIDQAFDIALEKRTASVRDLLKEGFGDLTFTLVIKKGRIHVANVSVGTTAVPPRS